MENRNLEEKVEILREYGYSLEAIEKVKDLDYEINLAAKRNSKKDKSV